MKIISIIVFILAMIFYYFYEKKSEPLEPSMHEEDVTSPSSSPKIIIEEKKITPKLQEMQTQSPLKKDEKSSNDNFDSSTTIEQQKIITFQRPQDFNINKSFKNDLYQLSFLNAFKTKNYEDAIAFGENILKIPDSRSSDWNYGNITHTTNIILGKIYLAKGDIPKAESYLMASINDRYIFNSRGKLLSPQLSSFGPDTSLAYDLFLIKRYEVVINYLKGTKKFWSSAVEDGELAESIKNVEDIKTNKIDLENSGDSSSDFPFQRREVID